jgi:hypothetical protein
MRSVVLISFALLSASRLSAQDIKSIPTVKPLDQLVEMVKDSSVKPTAKTVEFIEGVITPPEDQGYVKREINGKAVYYKETNNIMIQYDPK